MITNLNFFSYNKFLSKIYQKIRLKLFSKQIIRKKLLDSSEYLNIDISLLIEKAKVKDTQEEDRIWNQFDRTSINDYRDYYSKNIHYVERQDFYNLNHVELLSEFRFLKNNANLLDYGCGTAFILFEAKKTRNDLNIFLADIPQALTKDFAIWRFKKFELDYQWIDIPSDESIVTSSKFDLIRCHDVFEHSFYPLRVVNFFYKSLSKDGYLSFDYIKKTSLEKETTEQAQVERDKVFEFIFKNFNIIYNYKGHYVVKKINK